VRVIIKAKRGPTIYHMGDTDIFSDMALIAEIHQPGSPWSRLATASPATAALAVKRFFKLETVITCQYGSFPMIEANPDKFVAQMKGHNNKGLVPEKGKAVGL
jgi:L-ascorbate metabolism protein UlaG (beta-lactamase superfamily)